MEWSTCANCGMPIWGVPMAYIGTAWTHEMNDSKYCNTDQAVPEK